MRVHQRDVAAILGHLDRIDEHRQAILDILLPDPADDESADGELDAPGCPHPSDRIRDDSTLSDDSYTCTACGAAFATDPRTTRTTTDPRED